MYLILTAPALQAFELLWWVENCRLWYSHASEWGNLHTVDMSAIQEKRAAMPGSHSLAASDIVMAQAVLTKAVCMEEPKFPDFVPLLSLLLSALFPFSLVLLSVEEVFP